MTGAMDNMYSNTEAPDDSGSDARDLAGPQHWTNIWAGAPIPDPLLETPAGYRDVVFANLLREAFGPGTGVASVVEVGCARSVWLPYLGKYLGLRVVGVDYAEAGCELSRRMLERDGLPADVRCVDVFEPPADMIGSFDGAYSFGMVEHFDSTASAVAAIAALVRPGGVIVTEVPNLVGLQGWLMRKANPELFEAHHVLSAEQLASAHSVAGLEVVSSHYVMPFGVPAVQFPAAGSPQPSGSIRWMVDRAKSLTPKVWSREAHRGRAYPSTGMLAPYGWCMARKPDGPQTS